MLNIRTDDFLNRDLKGYVSDFCKETKDANLVMEFIDKTDFTEKEKYFCKIETLSTLTICRDNQSYAQPLICFDHIKKELKELVDYYTLTKEEKKDKSTAVLAKKKEYRQEYNDWAFLYQHAVFKCALMQLQSNLYEADELLESIEPICDAIPGYYQMEARVLKGRIIKRVNVKEAREIFNGALKMFNSADACFELAYLEMQQGNYDRAITLYKTLKSNSNDLINYQKMTRINLSRMYIKQKKYDLAEAELNALLEKEYIVKNAVYLEFGKLYMASENFDKAREYYIKLLNESNNAFDIVSASCDLAIIEKSCGNIDLALQYVEKAKQYRETNDNYVKLVEAKVYLYADRQKEAYDILWKMIADGTEKDKCLAADEILKYAYNVGDHETAKKALPYLKDSKNRIDQNTYDFYTFLLYYAGSKSYEAEALARKIYRNRPGSMAVFKTIIDAELDIENYAEAERLIKHAEENNELNQGQILSMKVLVYYHSNQIQLFNENFEKLLAIDDDSVAESLYYLGRDLYHYDYNLGFRCFEKARTFESSYHNAINLFYVATFMPNSEKQYQYKINVINELLSDQTIANDPISVGRLKISLLRTYIALGKYEQAKEMGTEIMVLSTDPFFVNDAKLALSILYRVEENYQRSFELAKEVFESEYFAKHAYIQMVKSMHLIDPEKARELYNSYSIESDRANLDYEYAVLLIKERKLDEALELLNKVKANKKYRPFLNAKSDEKIALIEEIKKQGATNDADFGNEKEMVDYNFELK